MALTLGKEDEETESEILRHGPNAQYRRYTILNAIILNYNYKMDQQL